MTATDRVHETPPATTGDRRLATLRRVARYLRPHRRASSLLALLVVGNAGLTVALPLLFQRLLDDGVLAGDMPVTLRWAAVASTVVLLLGLTQIGALWVASRLGHQVVYRLRNDAFAHAQQLPVGFYTNQRSGVLASRLTNDTQNIQDSIRMDLRNLLSAVAMLGFVIGAIAYLSWQLLVILLLVPVLLVPARRVGRVLHGISHGWLRSFSDLTTFITERLNVAGATLTHLYGGDRRDRRTFAERNARNRDLGVRRTVVAGVFEATLTWVSWTAVVVYLVGGYLVIIGVTTVGTLIALATLAPRLFTPLQTLSSTYVELMAAVASFERIFELLDRDAGVRHRRGARPLHRPARTVTFDRVRFGYRHEAGFDALGGDTPKDAPAQDRRGPARPVLRDLSFQLAPGQRVGIVGPSGSGKSTVAALLCRMHDPDEGTVRVGGADVRDLTAASLRATVGVLTQDAHMFHDTVRANLAYAAPEADDRRLVEACRAAYVWPVIEALPDGLDTVIGDRGYRMSGGEKQRLAIARLLLTDPDIVVLDEATAHLDTESERLVQNSLEQVFAGRTTLVIAHRLATVRDVDHILVLDGGQLVEQGDHAALLARRGRYAQLYAEQHPSQRDAAAV